jgi:hypothetical protein
MFYLGFFKPTGGNGKQFWENNLKGIDTWIIQAQMQI